MVSDYTTETFLTAFRRFISRRELCRALYSDRGTNFMRADSQLRALFRSASSGDYPIHRALASDGNRVAIQSVGSISFRRPVGAVKSVKHHLRRVIGKKILTFEEMTTFLSQIEATLNSKSLQTSYQTIRRT